MRCVWSGGGWGSPGTHGGPVRQDEPERSSSFNVADRVKAARPMAAARLPPICGREYLQAFPGPGTSVRRAAPCPADRLEVGFPERPLPLFI